MRLSRCLPAFVVVLALTTPRAALAAPATSDSTFGYAIPAKPGQLLSRASATWNVAAATQHWTWLSDDEFARTWISLGGLTVGTEAAVTAAGAVSYRAWYSSDNVTPVTSVPLAVSPGDVVRGSIERASLVPLWWRLTLDNLTTGATWTTVSRGIATPPGDVAVMVEGRVLVDEFRTVFPELPNLDVTRFDEVTVNGANPHLTPDQQVVMVAFEELEVVGTPSLPDAEADGFAACAWATTCATPV